MSAEAGDIHDQVSQALAQASGICAVVGVSQRAEADAAVLLQLAAKAENADPQ